MVYWWFIWILICDNDWYNLITGLLVVYKSKNLLTLKETFSKFLSSHSQIIKYFQLFFINLVWFRLSLMQVSPLFVFQNSAFDLGFTRPYLQSWLCQKQPWTKITDLYLGKIKSAEILKIFLFNRYIQFNTSIVLIVAFFKISIIN